MWMKRDLRFFYNLLHHFSNDAWRRLPFMPSNNTPGESQSADDTPTSASHLWRVLGSFALWFFALSAAGLAAIALLVGVALAMAYPQLPDISELAD